MAIGPMVSLARRTTVPTTQPQRPSACRVLERCETAAFRHRCQPRVRRTVALLYRGLRRPQYSLEEYTEQVLMLVAAQRDECPVASDVPFGAWVSARATQAVLQLYCDRVSFEHAPPHSRDADGPSLGRTGRDTIVAVR